MRPSHSCTYSEEEQCYRAGQRCWLIHANSARPIAFQQVRILYTARNHAAGLQTAPDSKEKLLYNIVLTLFQVAAALDGQGIVESIRQSVLPHICRVTLWADSFKKCCM